jgi:hypothetical protein
LGSARIEPRPEPEPDLRLVDDPLVVAQGQIGLGLGLGLGLDQTGINIGCARRVVDCALLRHFFVRPAKGGDPRRMGSGLLVVAFGAQLGAGAQGPASYSALEARLDASFGHGHIGLGARGVWEDAEFRRDEWNSGWSAVTLVRDVAVHGSLGDVDLAAAAGALSPAQVGRIVDGYRVALDDRWRTGVRTALHSARLDAAAEIDDVLDPRLAAAAISTLVTEHWGIASAVAFDPRVAWSGELGIFHRITAERARIDIGGAMLASPGGVIYASAELDRANARWTIRADARYGTDGLFGPLYRIEGVDDATGLGAGASFGVASDRGWLEVGARRRTGLGGIYTATAGAPMNRWLQVGAWAAVARDTAAGAAELRVAWSRSLFSAVHGARMYRFDAMEPAPEWSVVAWFGATRD